MGQKVNPIGFRLGINRSWDSIWYAKKNDYSKFLIEDYKIRQYIRKNIINAGVSEIIIERSSKKCSVSIHTSRPGFVIGKKGSDIEKIKNKISKITDSELYLNIKEIKKPELNAYLVAENNYQYDIDNLYVKEAYTGKSIVMKRFRPRAKGRASPIKKPFSRVTIILEEKKTELKKVGKK